MLSKKVCAEGWKKIVTIYRETIAGNNPDTTARRIAEEVGMDDALFILALVAGIKEHDSRISLYNRKFLASRASAPKDYMLWAHENPMIYAGIDDIHPAHIDNIISALRKLASE